MFLLPVIPFITDTPKLIEGAIKKAVEVGLDFVIFGGMTLKQGKQKDFFFNILKKHYPKLTNEYENIYTGDKWGNAAGEYYSSINQTFNTIAKTYKIPRRIPVSLFKDILSEDDLVIVILEHIDYFLKTEGRPSPYGYAVYSISKLKEPLRAMRGDLQKLKGVGKTTERIILEILDTGTSSYYKKLSNP